LLLLTLMRGVIRNVVVAHRHAWGECVAQEVLLVFSEIKLITFVIKNRTFLQL